jgi:hypothetical protein
MIRVSFIDGQHRDIGEPDSLHRDAEFLSFQKGETTLHERQRRERAFALSPHRQKLRARMAATTLSGSPNT